MSLGIEERGRKSPHGEVCGLENERLIRSVGRTRVADDMEGCP